MTGFLITFVNYFAIALQIAIFARVLLSWIPIRRDSPIAPVARIIYDITEPILAPIRRVLPSMGMIDLSPMVAIFLIFLIQSVLLRVL